jgi:hypothetical protein
MAKPIIFFSHSSRDKKELVQLKELFVQKTSGSIDVFLSSDGQSIPFGRNWVFRIQEALDKAKIMIVFISLNSLKSHWVSFESGYAYSKGIRVVPVGFLGVDLTTLSPPLNLLQGFNINNLIILTHEEFGHTHPPTFTAEEYREICMSSGMLSSAVFGEYGPLIDDIYIPLTRRDGILESDAPAALADFESILARNAIEYTKQDSLTGDALNFHGVSIDITAPDEIGVRVAPLVADVALPTIEKCIREIRAEGVKGISISFRLSKAVDRLDDQHKITAHLYGSDVVLLPHNFCFKRQEITFTLDDIFDIRDGDVHRTAPLIHMIMDSNNIPLSQIHDLFQLLFERQILFLVTVS